MRVGSPTIWFGGSGEMTTSILITEDHPSMRSAMRAVLEGEGYDIREAGDGPTALALIAERAPDVMFLDLHMPGVTGEEVLKEIKSNEQTSSIRVIVVTAQGEEGRRNVLSLGADAYFQKPYTPAGLIEAIDQVLASPPVQPSGPSAGE